MPTALNQRYSLDHLLGQGGMASVHAGRHRNGNRVAIKLLHPEASAHEETKRRFLREGYVANAVDSPGVVRVIDDDVADDGRAFLVMELLDGETLQARAERVGGRLPPLEVLMVIDQVLSTLAAAHDKGILHRDVKPENLFLTTDGRVKLLDFGIARMREAGATPTRTGTMMGTPAFMAPEQALGKSSLIDGRTDLWALGATMFTLLSGQYVHPGETGNEHLVMAATRRARPLAGVQEGIPREVSLVVDRALMFEPERRFATARAMQEAVRDAYAVLTGGGSPSTSTLRGEHQNRPENASPAGTYPPVLRAPPSAPRRAWLATATLALATAGLATALIATRTKPDASASTPPPEPAASQIPPASASASHAASAEVPAPPAPAVSSAPPRKTPRPQPAPPRPLDFDRRH